MDLVPPAVELLLQLSLISSPDMLWELLPYLWTYLDSLNRHERVRKTYLFYQLCSQHLQVRKGGEGGKRERLFCIFWVCIVPQRQHSLTLESRTICPGQVNLCTRSPYRFTPVPGQISLSVADLLQASREDGLGIRRCRWQGARRVCAAGSNSRLRSGFNRWF